MADETDLSFSSDTSNMFGDYSSSLFDPYRSLGTDPFGGLNQFTPTLPPTTGNEGYAQQGTFGAPTGTNTNLFSTLMQALTGGGAGNQTGQQPGVLPQVAGAALPAAGIATGIGGIIQALASGRPVTSQQIRSTVQSSPQQAQLTGTTLQALQNLQGLAQNAELQQAVKSLASGQLPISPDLVDQVTKAFGATAGGVAQQSIENARQRGFSGGTELLGGAGSPQYSQSLAQLQSDVSQALVNLALGLPTTAANIQSSLVGNQAQGIGLQEGLLGQLQQFAGMQGGQNSRTLAPMPNLSQFATPIAQLSAGLGRQGVNQQLFSPQNQSLSGAPPQMS